MPKIGLSGGAYQARSVIASAQRALNLVAEPMPQVQGEPSQFAYYPTPGLRQLGALPKGPVRAIKQVTTGGVYAVGGDTVYLVNSDWSSTALGTISPGRPYPASMQDNGNTLFLVDGTTGGWTVDLASNAFAAISDPAFYGADRVDFLDTYFVFNKPGTPQFYTSDSLATTFDSLYFANKESFSDLLVTVAVAKREIWLIGDRTTEIWYNAGSSDFPFAQIQGTFVDQGCRAKYSVAVYDDAVYWLGGNRAGQGIVLKGAGYQNSRISTFAIEAEMVNYPRIDDAIGFTYLLAGHPFYVLTFPAADKTWVYDIVTQQWHEWLWIDNNGEEHRHRANCMYAINGMVVAGDHQNGNLYAVETTALTDNGQPIKRQRSFPHIINQMDRVYHRQFIADIESGNPSTVTIAEPPPSPAGVWTELPVAAGDDRGGAYAISADGHVTVGFTGTSTGRRACYWVDGGAAVVIGTDFSEAFGVSGDGSVIVGTTVTSDYQPFLWTSSGGLVSFGSLGDRVYGISADGSWIVGTTGSPEQACYWNRSYVRTDLGYLPGGDSSRAFSVSADGTYITGYSNTTTGGDEFAILWTAAGGMVDLGLPPGDPDAPTSSRGFDVSDDGTIVVGDLALTLPVTTNGGFRWTSGTGMVRLPITTGVASTAVSISGDGSTIAGYSEYPGSGNQDFAYWTSAGITVPMPPSFSTFGTYPTGVSADGSAFVGYTFGAVTQPWLYQLSTAPPPAVPHPPPGTQVFLDWSDDRGHTFGNPVGQPIGAKGAYLTSVQWQRLGYARDRVFRLTWSVPVATALQGAFIEVDTNPKS